MIITEAKRFQQKFHPKSTSGSCNPRAKLTEDDVRNIFFFREARYTQLEIANLFSISRGVIARILIGMNWVNIYKEFLYPIYTNEIKKEPSSSKIISSRKSWTPERRIDASNKIKLFKSRKSLEEKRIIGLKAWETRRRKNSR